MIVKKGSVDVITYFNLVDSAAGTPETGLTITNIDATYTRAQAAAVKNDLTALAATTTAHTDNKGIEVDATNAPGLYRVDFPDAAFATGADRVILTVTCSGCAPAHLIVELVNYDPTDAVRLGLTSLPNAAADAAGGLPISDAGGLDLDAKIGALTYGTANRVNVQVYGMEAGTVTAAAIANGAIDAATFAADVDAEFLSYIVDDATRIDASALNTLSSHDPGATLGTSTLTQAQVTGGAYALSSASFAFNAALDFTTTQKASVNAEADTALTDAKAAYAAAIEAAILDEGDATALLAAISAKVETFLINEGDATATLAAIGTAVRTELATELARMDAAITTRMATYTQPTGFLAANFTTGIPISGDLSATMKTSVGTVVDTSLATYDAPTHAEMTSELAAVLAAIAALNNISSAGVSSAVTTALTTAIAESYRATGSTGSVAQLLYEILGNLINFANVGTLKTVTKLDKSTTAKTYTYDDGTTPTAIEETT